MSEERDQPVAEEPIEGAAVEGVADEAHAQGDDQQLDDDGNPVTEEAEDDSEEIEHEGEKYRVPKALKESFLRQADYTRKTQEVAEARRTVEARHADIQQQAETVQALRIEYGKVHALESQVEAFEKLDWAGLRIEDPDSARLYYDQYREAKDSLRDARDGLTQKEQEHAEQQRTNSARQLQETWGELTKDIPGWNADSARQVADFAREKFGVRPEELRNVDARTWKIMHAAQTATAELDKIKSKTTTAQRTEKVAGVQPAKTVGAKASGYKPGLDDSLPIEEWNRRRQAQLAKAR